MTVAEAEEMVAVCQERNVLLQEAFMWRHHPRSLRARELLIRGDIGPLRLICAHFSFDIDRSDWRLDPRRGGGAVWDIGCYGVNAARYFTRSEPSTIHSRAAFNAAGADVSLQIALAFPGDVLVNIDCSFMAPFRCEVEVVGERGSLTLPNTFLPPPEAQLLVRRDTASEASVQTLDFDSANQYAEMVNSFCASVAAGKLQDPAENGLANMRVLETAIQQARAARS
jgi:predicted dehydrogenase